MATEKPPLRGVEVGIQLLVSVLLAGGAGFAVDQWLGSQPWAMLVGGMLGFAAWLRVLWKVMQAK